MNKKLWCVALLMLPLVTQAKQWTLQECIDYALANNISLNKIRLQRQSAHEEVLHAQAQLLPSLSASTSQSVGYTPWVMGGVGMDGYTRQSIDKTYYNGSYTINANWTVWNGNQNRNTVKLNQLAEQRAALDSAAQARNIQEQIVQYFVQILYTKEAVATNKEMLKTSETNEERGKEMVNVGKMSRADLAQLTAQRAQSAYAVVQAETQVKNYIRQLKQLLQLTDEEFDVVLSEPTEELALRDIPSVASVYEAAVSSRPEIKAYQNAMEQSDLNIKLAKASRLPTLTANAGISTSTTTMNSYTWANQLKYNFTSGAGFTLSVPIFDNRAAKTAIRKATLQRQSSALDLKEQQTTLYSTVENYWLQAQNNQDQYRAAKVSVESAQASYDLLREQFRLGLKNIVELMTGQDNLVKAKQAELEAKFLAILNIDMLRFYQSGVLRQ